MRHVVCVGMDRNIYRVLVGKRETRRLLGTPRYRWQNKIQISLNKIVWKGTDVINLLLDRHKQQAAVTQ
jgi:hypothetical protein